MIIPAQFPPEGYQIRRLLGDGANGLVYLAVDLRDQREVALKEFRIGEESAQRFFRELSLLFTLNHPHLIRCLNFVHGKDASNFLVLEFAPGGSLRQRLNQDRTLSLEETEILARHIAGALECAHRHSVIHCDVKPENILLANLPNEPLQFKLTDLGIAHHRLRDPLPRLGGSPRYMAPEQFYHHPTPASDFYSLGIVLFECLTGEAPFVGNNEYLFNAHQQEPPDLESIPCPSWRRLLSQMLDKHPDQRPTSWEAMENLLNRAKVPSPAPTSPTALEIPASLPLAETRLSQGMLIPLGEERLIPGARDLWLPFASRSSRLWVIDERSIDWLDVESGKLQPREKIGRFLIGSLPVLGDARAAVFSDELHVFPNPEGRPNIFPVPPQLCSLIELTDGGFWAADGYQVFRLDHRGRLLWTESCPSYVAPTLLAASPDGHLLAARGPTLPALMHWSPKGQLLGVFSSGEPILGLGFDPQTNAPLLVVPGTRSESTCRLMALENGQLKERSGLNERVFASRWISGHFLLFTMGHEVVIMNTSGQIIGRMEVSGSPVQVVWIPRLPGFAVLSTLAGTSRFQRYQLQTVLSSEEAPAPSYVHHV
ncbi:MAG: serine/threonine-protein kinase [Verrucomicrobiia bacterium]